MFTFKLKSSLVSKYGFCITSSILSLQKGATATLIYE